MVCISSVLVHVSCLDFCSCSLSCALCFVLCVGVCGSLCSTCYCLLFYSSTSYFLVVPRWFHLVSLRAVSLIYNTPTFAHIHVHVHLHVQHTSSAIRISIPDSHADACGSISRSHHAQKKHTKSDWKVYNAQKKWRSGRIQLCVDYD